MYITRYKINRAALNQLIVTSRFPFFTTNHICISYCTSEEKAMKVLSNKADILTKQLI